MALPETKDRLPLIENSAIALNAILQTALLHYPTCDTANNRKDSLIAVS